MVLLFCKTLLLLLLSATLLDQDARCVTVSAVAGHVIPIPPL